MLSLSRSASKEVTKNIGFNNTEFLEGSIEKLDELDKDLNPLIADKSVDIILSNCVLNLVSPESRNNLLRFKNLKFAERSAEPWKVIEDIEFRTVTLVGNI